MNDNLPPLSIPDKQGCEDDPMYGILPVDYYTAEQMQAYARAAIERQSVPDGSHQLLKRLEWQEVRHEYRESEYFCPVCDEFKKDGHRSDCELAARLAAAPQPVPKTPESGGIKNELAQPQPVQAEGIAWPKAKDVGRYGDMSPSAHMRVGLDSDNDAYVSVWDEHGGGCVEFCNGGSGGGSSMKTRLALIALMVAMEEDNAARPDKDWWARRGAASKQGEKQ